MCGAAALVEARGRREASGDRVGGDGNGRRRAQPGRCRATGPTAEDGRARADTDGVGRRRRAAAGAVGRKGVHDELLRGRQQDAVVIQGVGRLVGRHNADARVGGGAVARALGGPGERGRDKQR